MLPPRRRVHDQDDEEEEEEEEEGDGRSNRPAQASVLYQDLLMSDVEDDASEEEGDNPFSCRFTIILQHSESINSKIWWTQNVLSLVKCPDEMRLTFQPYNYRRAAATRTERLMCDLHLHRELRRQPAWAWSRTKV